MSFVNPHPCSFVRGTDF